MEQQGGVGRTVQRQRNHRAEPGLRQQVPQPGILTDRRELARTVVNQEDLHQQRRTGEQRNVDLHQLRQHRGF
ncbi:hypothetical protein D3C80_1761460 [compost metagenome]